MKKIEHLYNNKHHSKTVSDLKKMSADKIFFQMIAVDFASYHNADAERELTLYLTEQIDKKIKDEKSKEQKN